VPVVYLKSGTEPFISAVEGLVDVARDYDAVIATAFHTVDWMHDLAGGHAALGYYIQDYEPDFFDEGTAQHKQAVASYQTVPGLKLFTKTGWNRRTLAERLGAEATEIGPSYDWDLFHPAVEYVEDGAPVRIVAMVRPATPRRGPAITMDVLRRLKQKYGPRVAITIFGTRLDDPRLQALPHDFEFACAGEQPVEGVAHLLRHADVFLDFSVFQAMGLTAMEAMASGAAVIGPAGSGLEEVVVHEENGLLIDTGNVEACLAAADRVVADTDFRNKLRRNGFDVARFHPEASAARILDVLFPEET
jgi:glycosyltransferase involved in cell wall biosynthesis